jgi:hypothetical protein
MTGFVLMTRSGRLFRQHPGQSDGPSVFMSRENADSTNASTLAGTGTVIALAGGPVEGKRQMDGYWLAE